MQPIEERDRPRLCRMLETSQDFPQNLLYLHRRPGGHGSYETFAAWRANEIVGMLSGSFDSDFTGGEAFASFALPSAPHAFLDRVHVRESDRGSGVGRALVAHYAAEAAARRCSFLGGSLDLSSDPVTRKAFFINLGFEVCEWDNFGAALIAPSPD